MDKRLITVILMAVVVALVITAIFYQITVGRLPTLDSRRQEGISRCQRGSRDGQ